MKNYAIVPKSALAALLHRNERLEQLTRELYASRERETALLYIALHELATERDVRDRQAFARKWTNEKRREWTNDNVPRKEMRVEE